MSESQSNPQADAAQQLEALARQVDQLARKAESRAKWMTIISVVSLVVVGGYLGFFYSQLSAFDSEALLDNAQSMAEQQIPAAAGRVGDLLTEEPFVNQRMAEAERALLAAPAQLREALMQSFANEVGAGLDQLSEDLYGHLRDQLTAAAVDLRTKGYDLSDEQQVNELMTELAAIYGKQTRQMIDVFYRDSYQPHARHVLDYLEHLAVGRELTEREVLQKRLLETVMSLHAKQLRQAEAEGQI